MGEKMTLIILAIVVVPISLIAAVEFYQMSHVKKLVDKVVERRKWEATKQFIKKL